MLANDHIIAINGTEILSWDPSTRPIAQVKNALEQRKEDVLSIQIIRDGELKGMEITASTGSPIGFYFKNTRAKVITQKYDATQSIIEGFNYGYWTLYDYIAQFKFVFTKKGASQLGGFGTIGSLFPAEWNWRVFWERTALLSIILAFMNVLPIPALDGGHVVFLTYEMLTGRKPHQKVLEYAQMAGIILLLGLFVFANGNDIYRFISS